LSVGLAVIRFQNQQNSSPAVEARWRRTTGDAIALYGKALTDKLEINPQRDLSADIRGAEKSANMRLSLLDAAGNKVAGNALSHDAEGLVRQVQTSNSNLSVRTTTGFIAAEPVVSSSNRRYIIVS